MGRQKLYKTEEEIRERNRKKARKSYWKNKMITDLDKILIEWAYRTPTGKVDTKSNDGLIILDSVLRDFGWPYETRNTLIGELQMENLTTNKIKESNTMNFENQQSFSDKVISVKNLWDSNSDKYSSTPLGVYNTNMSPKEYFTYVRKQSDIDSLEEYGVPNTYHLVSNSPNNRKESKTGDLFMIRTRYAYTMIAGVSDSNFFPVSLIDNSDDVGDKISHLILKDRGNLTSVLMRYNSSLRSAFR